MPAGIQIFNTNGVVQIDENMKNPRLVLEGSVGKTQSNNDYGGWAIDMTPYGIDLEREIPILLLRPHEYNKFVGGVSMGKLFGPGLAPGNYFIFDTSDCGCDYAIFSMQVGGVRDPGNVGLQVFNALGELTYDSNNRHTRIIANMHHAPVVGNQYPYSFGISGFSSMPWIVANPLVASYKGEQDGASGVYMRVDSLNQVTVDHRSLGAAFISFIEAYPTSPFDKNAEIYVYADPYSIKRWNPDNSVTWTYLPVSYALADWA